jgi:hypothetical protein
MSETSNEVVKGVSLKPYIMRFVLIFAAFSTIALVVVTWYQISGNTGLSFGILIASVLATSQKFVGEQKRVFTKKEKTSMAFYSMLVSLIVSFLLFLAYIMATGEDPKIWMDQLLELMPLWMTIVSLVVAAVFNFGMLYLAYGIFDKHILKGMVKKGEV